MKTINKFGFLIFHFSTLASIIYASIAILNNNIILIIHVMIITSLLQGCGALLMKIKN